MDPISRKIRSSDDRISKLPDELLISIISSTLTLKEAAATSILSKRWKTLWTYFYGFLDFDDDYNTRLHKTYLDSEYIPPKYFCYGTYVLFKECTSKYIDHVNKVLNSHQRFGVPINKLRIYWMLGIKSKTVINSWIDFVVKNKVQHFEFDVLRYLHSSGYKFSLETLMMGTTGIGFPNLSVLRLSFVDMTEEALAYLLSSDNCPLLQHIYVKSARSLGHVKVVGNSKLKSLELDRCWRIEDVEICSAVNMVSFGFRGSPYAEITFENVPLLTEALFGGGHWQNVAKIPTAQPLWSIASQLEILRLDLTTFTCAFYFVTSQFHKFDRVKHLEVDACTLRAGDLNMFVTGMIYGCPRLQKLSLKRVYNGDEDEDKDEDKDEDEDEDEDSDAARNGLLRGYQDIRYQHQHECLQTVEYKGWDGNEDDLEFITDLPNISVVLDKVTIDPRTKFRSKEHELQVTYCRKEFLIHDKKREESARKAAEKLRTILPQKVSLVLL